MSFFSADETREWFSGVSIELLSGFGTVLGDVAVLFAVETAAGSFSKPVPVLVVAAVPVARPPVVPSVVSSVPTARSSRIAVVVTSVGVTLVSLTRV